MIIDYSLLFTIYQYSHDLPKKSAYKLHKLFPQNFNRIRFFAQQSFARETRKAEAKPNRRSTTAPEKQQSIRQSRSSINPHFLTRNFFDRENPSLEFIPIHREVGRPPTFPPAFPRPRRRWRKQFNRLKCPENWAYLLNLREKYKRRCARTSSINIQISALIRIRWASWFCAAFRPRLRYCAK